MNNEENKYGYPAPPDPQEIEDAKRGFLKTPKQTGTSEELSRENEPPAFISREEHERIVKEEKNGLKTKFKNEIAGRNLTYFELLDIIDNL